MEESHDLLACHIDRIGDDRMVLFPGLGIYRITAGAAIWHQELLDNNFRLTMPMAIRRLSQVRFVSQVILNHNVTNGGVTRFLEIPNNMPNILVVGGAGYIGAHIVS